MKNDLFVGIEAEGPERGVNTLFVGDKEITQERIDAALEKYPDINRVYFGAGNKYGPPKKASSIFPNLLERGFKIVLEVRSPIHLDFLPIDIINKIHVVLTIPVLFNASKNNLSINSIKMVFNDQLSWRTLHKKKYNNYLSDELYEKDIQL